MSYTLTCLPMYSFFVSSSVAANIASSSMTINPVNARAFIQPFLHNRRQRDRQTKVRKTSRYDLPPRNNLKIDVSKSYLKYCVSFASTWDVSSTNAEKFISPVVILIRSQQRSGALCVLYATGGITRISFWCIKAAWSPFSSG